MRLMVLLLSIVWVTSVLAFPSHYPIPDGAIEVNHIRLIDTGGEQDYFKIKLPYLSTLVLEHYRKVFITWRECKHDEKWQSFDDLSGLKPQAIHQLLGIGLTLTIIQL